MAVHPRRAPRRPPLSSPLPAQVRGPASTPASGLTRLNSLPYESARAALLHCCGSRRWAHRLAAHRPYPDTPSLLAAADEAAYDLSQADLTEALAGESSAELGHGAPYAALLALDAARAEYERTFGHAFVICLDGHPPEEQVDQLLAAIRRRMAHEVDEERSISADELRLVARSRLVRLLDTLAGLGGVGPDGGPSGADFGLFAPVG
ncbi:2-oxo-4-hydroxy-4-carboxy-5-ureidoimidazoline decarboxylase [Streptomyces sp. NBC_00249]|uniref:2-oxo-4-hydroxy-4-carboxy-5-ureidoimidazoline decarboxylase n=1 Tax=Streptomyces sp. NBC_00249 TaxID=2975690 RepID=UPI00224D17B7|nr:2-oxo-4-hydroxy-4-carboxy-5-ureidoimidazoline decarboxylase [Streptomyces sp. NBC_00249]MCX5194842.1 2-oxo-4-hydroxy-4-carboxy-5-ureidoimidazoline decarboxylase [Streptomyces sp. NBC_00249]